MRYLCLVYIEEGRSTRSRRGRATSSPTSCSTMMTSCGGRATTSPPPRSSRSAAATTLRMRNGKLSMTDGPFAETKEHLGGFILIEARDLNEAIQAASKIPMVRMGSIEVRPIMELERKRG